MNHFVDIVFPFLCVLLLAASCTPHFFLSISSPLSLVSMSLSLYFSICDIESGPYLMCSSFSISISRQVAPGDMLEPAPPTPPIYLPCATPRMATCLWMVAMLTMSQVRFETPAHQNLHLHPYVDVEPLGDPPTLSCPVLPKFSLKTNPTHGAHGLEGKTKSTSSTSVQCIILHWYISLILIWLL